MFLKIHNQSNFDQLEYLMGRTNNSNRNGGRVVSGGRGGKGRIGPTGKIGRTAETVPDHPSAAPSKENNGSDSDEVGIGAVEEKPEIVPENENEPLKIDAISTNAVVDDAKSIQTNEILSEKNDEPTTHGIQKIDVQLIVCFCRAFDGIVYFQLVRPYKEEWILESHGSGIYSSRICVPYGYPQGSIYYKKNSWAYRIEEKLSNDSWWSGKREFFCDSQTSFLQFLSKDCYSISSYWQGHENCTQDEMYDGFARLLIYIAKNHSTKSIADFNKILLESLIPTYHESYRVRDGKPFWDSLSDGATINNDPDLFIKKILLVNRFQRIYSLTLDSVYRTALNANAGEVLKTLFGMDQNLINAVCQFITKLVQINSAASLPWSYVLMILKPNSNAAETLLSNFSNEIVGSLSPFHSYFSEDALFPILKNLPSVQSLKLIAEERGSGNRSFGKIVKQILLKSTRNSRPRIVSESERELEFAAIQYFANENEDLYNEIFSPTIVYSFSINAISHLQKDDVAALALFPTLRAGIPTRFKKQRVDEFKNFIQNDIESIEAASVVYGIISRMIESLPSDCDPFIEDVHSVLPVTPGISSIEIHLSY